MEHRPALAKKNWWAFIVTAHLDPSLCRVPYLGCLLPLPRPRQALAWQRHGRKKKIIYLLSQCVFSDSERERSAHQPLLYFSQRFLLQAIFYNTSETEGKKNLSRQLRGEKFPDKGWKVEKYKIHFFLSKVSTKQSFLARKSYISFAYQWNPVVFGLSIDMNHRQEPRSWTEYSGDMQLSICKITNGRKQKDDHFSF